jgi:hypothetical protein
MQSNIILVSLSRQQHTRLPDPCYARRRPHNDYIVHLGHPSAPYVVHACRGCRQGHISEYAAFHARAPPNLALKPFELRKDNEVLEDRDQVAPSRYLNNLADKNILGIEGLLSSTGT